MKNFSSPLFGFIRSEAYQRRSRIRVYLEVITSRVRADNENPRSSLVVHSYSTRRPLVDCCDSGRILRTL